MRADSNATPSPAVGSITARRVAGAPAVAAVVVLAAAGYLALVGGASSAQVAAPRLDVTMGHHVLRWQARPGDVFTVRLTNPNAVTAREPAGEKAFVRAWADGSGAVEVKLHYRTNDFAYKAIEPGDRLELAVHDGPTLLDYTIPAIGADADDDGTRVMGRAPAGAAVTITLEPEDTQPPFEAIVSADANGHFVLDLPADQRLAEGAGGTAVFVDGVGHRYTSVFARRHVELEVGGTRIDTRASLQAPVRPERVVVIEGIVRRRGFGMNLVPAVGLTSDGRRPYLDDHRYLLAPGTVVTVSQTSVLLGRADTWLRTLPDLSIRFDGVGVAGRAPAGAALEVDVRAPDQSPPVARLSATADASGTFAALLPGGVRPGAGWRADVRLDTGDGIWLSAQAVLPRIEASVDAAHVALDMQPLEPVTLTVQGPDASVRYQSAHRADAYGRVDVHLDTGQRDPDSGWTILTPLRPGDTLAVDFSRQDPLVFTVPTLVAQTDPDAEAIAGTAPPNSALAIDIVAAGATVHRSAQADTDGRWRLELAGAVDLEPDVYARANWVDRGHRFYTFSAARSLLVGVERADVETAPYIGYPMALTLTTAEGQLAARGSWPLQELAAPAIGVFGYEFTIDRFDRHPRPQPGDALTVRVGNDAATLVVPPFEARVHVADNLVLGRTIPDGRVHLETSFKSLLGTPSVDIVADATGAFRYAFGDSFDIAFNDVLYATLDLGRHQLVHSVAAPGLTLDLSAAVLEGTLEPEVAVSARVGALPLPAGTGHAVTDRRAEFAIPLFGPDGRPAVPRAGQPVVVEAPAATAYPRLDWSVPNLELRVNDDGSVTGQTEPGAAVYVQRGFARLSKESKSASANARVAADGRFEAQLGSFPQDPGTVASVAAELADGHRAIRREVSPIMRVRHGTPQVCGIGMPNQPIRLDSHDIEGTQVASAMGWTDRQGRFDLRLTAADGTPARLDAGQRLSGNVGDAGMAMTLGPMAVSVSPTGTLVAEVLPDARLRLSMPAVGCLEERTYHALMHDRTEVLGLTSSGIADGVGAYDRQLDPKRLEYGVSMVVFTPSGHSYMGAYFPSPLGTAYVDEDRIAGIASPGSRVAVRLEDAAGGLIGTGEAMAALEDGRFVAALSGADGQAVVIRPGHRAAIETDDGRAAFEVEPLAFDFSPAGGIAVTAPPNRRLELTFAIGERTEVLAETSDASGRFAFRPDEVPPRAGWTLADVTGIEVVLPQPDGNATGSAWVAERGDGRRVWLPWGVR